jgi:hypothetical protein
MDRSGGSTVTDRELLELAAKAAGYLVRGPMVISNEFQIKDFPNVDNTWRDWNPLTDDGDALRLMIKLEMLVHPMSTTTSVLADGYVDVNGLEPHNGDAYAATRRAIVRAAAEIGKGIV